MIRKLAVTAGDASSDPPYSFCHSDAERGGGISDTKAREKRYHIFIIGDTARETGIKKWRLEKKVALN